VNARSAGDVEAAADVLGYRALGIVADVGDASQCQRFVDAAVERFGRMDVLVNNAGLGIFKSISEMTVEERKLQVDVNLGGVFYCSKAALPHLSATGDGFIVNIASLASRNPFAGGTGYNASKFGVLGLTEAMMLDVRYRGVRVSIVMPGSVDSYFNDCQQVPEQTWRLHVDDCAAVVLQVLSYPKEAHVSRIEMRPSQPKR
jgi:3-oxoacyl-[acyl-carrier protein] reductase